MSRIGNKDVGQTNRSNAEELRETHEGRGEQPTTGPDARSTGAKKVSAADAERMVSQAGFARSGAKKKGTGLELGDASRGPIPLPEDDVDTSEWSSEGLAEAQAQLLGHTVQLRRSRGRAKGGLSGAFAAIIGGDPASDDAGEDGDATAVTERHAHLQALAAQTPPPPPAMAALAKSIQAQFGIDFTGSPPGAALVAASLLVAGHPNDVQVAAAPGGKELVADALMQGLQRVVEEGHTAAEDARRRSEGVTKNLAMHRTFVPKR